VYLGFCGRKQSLVGQQLGTFTRVATVVREALEKTLTRILTPKRNIDILRDARAVNAAGSPYSVVFVGVNGVGKSTSLSKVCSWLMQNEFRVLIAACDTFRSGAVEQLNVHAKRLGAPLFSRGL
jgi:signal recognition particle receptor subunit alpha